MHAHGLPCGRRETSYRNRSGLSADAASSVDVGSDSHSPNEQHGDEHYDDDQQVGVSLIAAFA